MAQGNRSIAARTERESLIFCMALQEIRIQLLISTQAEGRFLPGYKGIETT
jgi:hypothetical protein